MTRNGKVVELQKAREQKQEDMKREYERVLFNRMLGCYTVIEKLGLKSVEMLDISKAGCAFRTPHSDGAFNEGEEIDFRMYFSTDTYLPTKVKVMRVTKTEDNGQSYWHYGCTFDNSLSTYAAIESLVNFIGTYASLARQDKGEKQIWFL